MTDDDDDARPPRSVRFADEAENPEEAAPAPIGHRARIIKEHKALHPELW